MNGLTLFFLVGFILMSIMYFLERRDRLFAHARLYQLGEVLPYLEQYLYVYANSLGGDDVVQRWIDIISNAYWCQLSFDDIDLLEFIDYWLNSQRVEDEAQWMQ